jgi:C4-dicarboxylate transporter DctM subunit
MFVYYFIILTFILIILGVPISFALGLGALFYMWNVEGLPVMIFAQRMLRGADSYTLMAIPMFILAGSILNKGGLTYRVMALTKSFVGHITGGLAHMNILISMIFAGISGSANADAAGIGKILIPAMIKEGYEPNFSAAITASSSCIGPLIPPSVLFVLYGGIALVPIADLFLAGAVPGILLGLFQMAISYIIAKKNKYPRYPLSTLKQLFKNIINSWTALVAPIIIVGGILSGVFTPTEAGGVAVMYSIVISIFIYREVKVKDLMLIVSDAVISSAMVMFIISTGLTFTWMISRERIPIFVLKYISLVAHSSTEALFLISILLLFLGMFFSVTANLIMMLPVLLPVADAFKINPIQFGVFVVFTLLIGAVTPPVGLPMHIVCNIAKIPITEFVKANMPFYISFILTMILIILFPQVTLWLPSLFGM